MNALTELVRDRPVREVTVKDLADHARIGRSTFYEHFDSIEGLVCWLVDELVEELRGPAGELQLAALLGFVGGMPEVSEAFLKVESCAKRCETAIAEALPSSDPMACRFAAAGTMALLKQWLAEGAQSPLDDVVRAACELVDATTASQGVVL